MTTAGRSRRSAWVWIVSDAIVVILGVLWLVTGQLWALLSWEAVAVAYLVVSFAFVWGGSTERAASVDEARTLARLAWIAPLLASLVGVSAAVTALVARAGVDEDPSRQLVLAVAASIGVIVSWTLLQVGFAELYSSLDESDPTVDAIEFPGRDTTAFLNYLYFAFTVGTAFATSDARVMTLAVRRVVLVHSVVAFFYNALVVATGIQVLQQVVST